MSRRTEQSRRGQNFAGTAAADFTINSYANSDVKSNKGRIKKSALIMPDRAIPLPIDDNADDDNLDDKPAMKTFKNNSNELNVAEHHIFNEFPNDFWWILSEYIVPEDVGRFAMVCKATYSITGSVKFWKTFYNRYYRREIRLPIRLQPDCMARPGGLRACVIRSLYYNYTPFIQRLIIHPQEDFHAMTRRYVDRFWFTRKATSKWLYFYKLRRKPMDGSRIAESELLQRKNGKSLKSLRDVYMNPEEGCSLLIIQTTVFHPLPKLLEEMEHQPKFTIFSIGHHLTRSCNTYRLELKFANASRQPVASISYEPAVSVKVYDWWTPNYYKYVKQGFRENLEFLDEDKDPAEEIDADDDLWNFNFAQI